ncbi:Glycosyl transferase, group 1 [Pseudomonas syringae pv. atrofaciens]|uniref:glycosyltransferase family 4 protein n=1 Tax=Pseudomonas syringae TaxID=317 RepID=UPI000EFE420F|nr:glycosyltransferase family 1 protein [Pseudomonas syringae]RMP49590.1 Glycosyl transferase, group 1 [Pseudomonas syringae pv. atrofaciens]
MTESIKYSIDKFTKKTLDGWIFSPDTPGKHKEIGITTSNRKMKVTASKYRADLEQSKIGSGDHSFNIVFHPELSEDEYLSAKIMEVSTGISLQSADQISAQRLATKKTVYLEVSDLINFLRHEKRVTGIQRLVSQLCQSIIEEDRKNNYKFCTLLSEADNNLYEIERDAFKGLIGAVLGDIKGDGLTPLINLATSNTVPVNIADGDMLFGTGASFSFQNYTLAIKKLKFEKQIKYGTIVYDLIPYHSRSTLPPELSVRFSLWLSEIVSLSDILVSISEYTKKELDRFILDKNIVPNESQSTFIPLGSHPSIKSSSSKIQSRYFIEDDFCIFVSTIETRKNHAALIKAWEKLLDKNPPQLIIVGKSGWGFHEVQALVQDNKELFRKVTFIHDASDSDLEWLYSNCLFTVYPSLYEGWGLPVTESLTRGKFCICSNTTSLPEAGGIYADYFDPRDINDIASKVLYYIENRSEIKAREALIESSYRPRTWQDYALDLDNLLDATHQGDDIKAVDTSLKGGMIYRFSNVVSSKESFFDYIIHRSTAYSILSQGDWFVPESCGRWLQGNYGAIRIHTSQPQQKVAVYIKYWLPPNLDSISFEIAQNKEYNDLMVLRDSEIAGHKLIKINAVSDQAGCLQIEFIRRSHKKNQHPEPRDLFLSLISVAVAHDLGERIDILEGLLL